MSDEAIRGHLRAIERELDSTGRTWKDILPPVIFEKDADYARDLQFNVMPDGRMQFRLSTRALGQLLFGREVAPSVALPPAGSDPVFRVRFEGVLPPGGTVERRPAGKSWLGIPYPADEQTRLRSELQGELIIEEV